MRSQWGRYNLPRYTHYIELVEFIDQLIIRGGHHMHHLHYGLLGSNSQRKAQGGLDTYVKCSVFFFVSLCWKILKNYIYYIQYTYLLLVGGKTTSLKNMSSPVGVIFPNIWKNKTCSKPPTRLSPLCSVDSCLSPWNLRVSNRPTLMFIAG